jgi:hypothetical protein
VLVTPQQEPLKLRAPPAAPAVRVGDQLRDQRIAVIRPVRPDRPVHLLELRPVEKLADRQRLRPAGFQLGDGFAEREG